MLILENFGGHKKKLNLTNHLISIKNENKIVIAEIIISNGLMKLIQTQSLLYIMNSQDIFTIDSSKGSSKSARLVGYQLLNQNTVTIHVKI